MFDVSIVILASAAIPLAGAWRANRGTTLRHALGWAWLAWLAWLVFGIWPGILSAYAALTLTACSGIAVLGARRPGVVAWDFIVFSLLVVLWLGWAEGLLTGSELKLGGFRFAFLSVLLAVTVVNYLPTRLRLGSLCLALGLLFSMMNLAYGQKKTFLELVCIGLSPWFGWAGLVLIPRHGSDADRQWQSFRDRFGVVWAERLREQFNRAAHNAGWPVELRWNGLHSLNNEILPEWRDALIALQKRFVSN